MSIATLHYLSMNVRDGIITPPASPSDAGSQNYVLSRLQPSTDYVIDWGDEGATTDAATNASGTVTKAHTYADGGTYVITVTRDDDSEQIAAKLTVVVAESTPLTNTVPPAITGTENVGETLTTDDGTWTGDATITYAYAWQRSTDDEGTGRTPIAGADEDTYVLVNADFDKFISCIVTATNEDGEESVESNFTDAIDADAPSNSVAPAVTGTETVGQTLTCSNGTWTGDPTITFTRAWQRSNDGAGAGRAPIAGATNTTYVLQAADEGKFISCIVTASNVKDDVTQESDFTFISCIVTASNVKDDVTQESDFTGAIAAA